MGYIRTLPKQEEGYTYPVNRRTKAQHQREQGVSEDTDPTPAMGMVRPSRPTGKGKITVMLDKRFGDDAAKRIEDILRYGK